MRCSRCGNESPDDNRFCGMCGATLLSAPAQGGGSAQPVSVAAPGSSADDGGAAPAHAPESRRSATVISETPSSISGPSFLGLNDPSPRPTAGKRARLSMDPNSAPGSNLDYLLSEEEPRHHWGIGKILVILIALGLAAGFGYLRFKNQGLAWLSDLKKPAAAIGQNSSTPDNPSTPTTPPSITPDPQPPAAPAASTPQPTESSADNPQASGTAATPPPATSAPASAAPADSAKSDDTAPSPSPQKPPSPADKDTTSAKEDSTDTPAAPSKPSEKPKPTQRVPIPKPSAASRPVAPYDPVSDAGKYLYGRGAPQDCDRGMRLLKPAANLGNPKAMIEMGALYSAGLCTPHDLPTAYRWFALALRKDPENTSVQADLKKLWGEMTQPERQLAIKLTQ